MVTGEGYTEMTRGFYIGRFQPYHEGHHQAITEEIAKQVDELVVAVGSADASHTRHNPFTAGERVMMLTQSLVPLDIVTYVVPIEDLERNSVWVSHVRSMCPDFDIAFSNNPLVVRLFEEAGVPVRNVQMYNRERLEGTAIREAMIESGEWEDRVPDPVEEVIEEIDGLERIRTVSASDGNGS
jgi:nicotinamide-nucleotide adenylyltransferase